MGNDQHKIHSPHQQTIYINHSKFRNVKVLLDGNQKLLKTILGVYAQDYQKWRHDLQHSKIDSKYLLLPKTYHFQEKTLCGYSGTLELYFEDYRYVLSEQIYSRKEHNIYFDETDLWYLLLVLSSAQQEVRNKSNVKVGDIQPHNVFLNAQGQIKVTCTYTWPRQEASFGEAFENQRTYLSPEELAKLQRGLNLGLAAFQNDVFSIGLTVLSAGLLEDFRQFFNIQSKSCKLNTEKTNELLDQWRRNKKYSQILTGVISNLCQVKAENRIKDDQLWTWISQFKTQILTRQNFFIQSAPPKIDKEIAQIRKMSPQNQQVIIPHLNFEQQPQQLKFEQHQNRQNYLFNPFNDNSSSPINLRDRVNPKYVESYHESVPSTQTAVSSFYSAPHTQKQTNNQNHAKFDKQFQNNNFHKWNGSEKVAIKKPQEEYPIRPQLNLPDFQVPRTTLFQKNAQPKEMRTLTNNLTINNRNVPPVRIQFNKPPLINNNQVKKINPQRIAANPRVRPNDNGLSFFQNVIDPEGRRGGSIEQTVYIKSDYLNKYYRQ